MVGFHLDHEAHTISITIDGALVGVAFTDVPAVEIIPAICLGKDGAVRHFNPSQLSKFQLFFIFFKSKLS